MENIKVVIYEDKENYRNALKDSFQLIEGFELCDAFSNCNKLVEQMQIHNPDVVLMDIEMQHKSEGIDSLAIIKKKFPAIKVIMLTGVGDNDRLFRCINEGASGYIMKGKDHFTKIFSHITEVVNGGNAYSPDVLTKLTSFIKDGLPQNTNTYGLTETELKVLEYLARGLKEKDIADKLFKSRETVHKHKTNIYDKLKVHSETEAVTFVYKHRLLPPDMLGGAS